MFEALYDLASSNKQVAHLQGIRIINGLMLATNVITTAVVSDDRVNDLDCYVDAKTFITAFRNLKDKKPTFKQKGKRIMMTSGDYEVGIPLLDPKDFPDLEEPTGESYTNGQIVDSLVTGLSHLKPLLSSTNSAPCAGLVYIINNYAYFTDGGVIARTFIPISCNEPIILTKEFVDLVVDSGLAFTEVKFDPNTFSLLHASGWIHTNQHTDSPPLDFPVICKSLEELEIPKLEKSLHANLSKMIKINAGGVVSWDKGSVSLKSDSMVARTKIDSDVKVKLMASSMKKVLAVADAFDFSFSEDIVAWRGNGLEGMISVANG